jgi:hypothetical protein
LTERNHGQLTVDELRRLANLLGVDSPQLFSNPVPGGPPAEDDVLIEAALGQAKKGTKAEDLARGLGWTLQRTRLALRRLEKRLRGTGARLQLQSGKYRLVPAVGVLSPEERRGVEAASVARAGLSVSATGVLRRVVAGRADRQWLKDASNATLL